MIAPVTPQRTFMAQKKHSMAHRLAPVVCLAFCTCGFAQTPPPAARQPASAQVKVGAQAHAAKPSPSTAAKPSPTSPTVSTSLLDTPAQPAKISLVAGELTVQADNSSLSDILHQIAAAGGMKVEGMQAGGGQRVFGSYGPGVPREVLSELLNGSGYNVMMLGETSSGAPRELTLMARAGAAPSSPPSPNIVRNEENENQGQPTENPVEQDSQPEMPPGPGIGNGVRTPDQVLQNLQRMHEQQQQQEQQQEQQMEQQQQPDQQDQPDQPDPN
jgi:hypothetical protein